MSLLQDVTQLVKVHGAFVLAFVAWLMAMVVCIAAHYCASAAQQELKDLNAKVLDLQDYLTEAVFSKFDSSESGSATAVTPPSRPKLNLASPNQLGKEDLIDIANEFDEEVRKWMRLNCRQNPNPETTRKLENIVRELQRPSGISEKALPRFRKNLEHITEDILNSVLSISDFDIERPPRVKDSPLQQSLGGLAQLAGMSLIDPESGSKFIDDDHVLEGSVNVSKSSFPRTAIFDVRERGLLRNGVAVKKARVRIVE